MNVLGTWEALLAGAAGKFTSITLVVLVVLDVNTSIARAGRSFQECMLNYGSGRERHSNKEKYWHREPV